MQSQVPSQGAYVNVEQPSFSPNSLLTHSEVQEIDRKLSSGCYTCFNCWLYVIAVGAILVLINSLMQVFTYPILLVNALEGFIEFCFAIAMIEVFKTKKLEDVKVAWIFALVSFGGVAIVIATQASGMISLYGYNNFYAGVAVTALYYGLVVILPTYKIKDLIERRDFALKNSPYNV